MSTLRLTLYRRGLKTCHNTKTAMSWMLDGEVVKSNTHYHQLLQEVL